MKRPTGKYICFLLVLLFTGFFISGCGSDGSSGHWDEADVGDTMPPTVSRNTPAADASDVPIGSNLTADFSEAMAPDTISTMSFTLQASGGLELPGQVTYADLTVTFTPDSDLDINTEYTATITTDAKDLAGNALADNHVWTFTTDEGLVDANPKVSSTFPTDQEDGVALNKSITATFSEEMNPTTVDATTFTLSNNATSLAVTGAVTYVGTTATFKPSNDLAASTEYTATITTAAEDMTGNFLVNDQNPPVVSDYVWTFTTGALLDTTAPTVIRSYPVDAAADVPTGISLTATFSEAMDPDTIKDSTFILYNNDDAAEILGIVTYSGLIATFNPDIDLAADTEYAATITSAATDLAGNFLASEKVWTFTTAAALIDASPTVILTSPADLDEDVALNKSVTATFSERMNPATIDATSFTLQASGSPLGAVLAGDVIYLNLIATLNLDSDLVADTEYTATITADATDLTNNPLVNDQTPPVESDYVWTFTTGAALDGTPPTVEPYSPKDLAVDVALNKNISATFSEEMDSSTIDTASFTLQESELPLGPVLLGEVTYLGLNATLNPDSDLKANTEYIVTMTTDAKDLAGNSLAEDKVWTFTTIAELAQGPLPVDLGTAEDFAILSKTGISTTGTTFITGNIGVSPIDSTAITGFGLILDSTNTFATSPYVSGHVYAADYAVPTPAKMTAAISDLHTAYIDAAGRTTPAATELYAGDLSGRTIAPGLYKWSTGVLVASGTTVTLSGGANDVWILQIAGDLTIGTNAIVALDGGAQAKNIFWQVGGGTGATLETFSQFKGIILAAKGIEIKDEAQVVGRMLAESAVTLISNEVTQP